MVFRFEPKNYLMPTWLPVSFRIVCKILLTTFNTLNASATLLNCCSPMSQSAASDPLAGLCWL